jgi:hypothetical protein
MTSLLATGTIKLTGKLINDVMLIYAQQEQLSSLYFFSTLVRNIIATSIAHAYAEFFLREAESRPA